MTRITGHRGARGLWPENSLTGFREVLRLDVDAVEFDVHLTRAGELVVIHDAVLDRTTDASGSVLDLTPAARAALRLQGSTEPIPTLDQVLAVLSAGGGDQHRPDLHVELKPSGGAGQVAAIVQRVVAELQRFGVRSRCHLSSFDVSLLAACQQIAPDIPRLVSVNRSWADAQGGLATFAQGVRGLARIIAVERRLLAEQWDAIARIVPAERLGVWTVDDPAEIARWLGRGIGHLTTDRPDLALAVRDG